MNEKSLEINLKDGRNTLNFSIFLYFSSFFCYTCDMEKIGQILIAQHEFEAMKATLRTQAEQISKMELLIKYYEEQLHLAKRRQFGSSSEHSPNQLRFENMFNEAEDQSEASLPEPTIEEVAAHKRKKRVGKRAEDLAGLPVKRIDYEFSEDERICPECGDVMHDIGVTIRHGLEIIPAQVIHVEHAVHAYGCSNCDENSEKASIVKADLPAPLISGSLATPSAVAHIAVQKYVNSVPLYRQEKGLAYDGIVLSRQTMANWLIICAQSYLTSIYSLMIESFLQGNLAHADETTIQVLKEPDRPAQSKSYEWLYRTSRYSEHAIVIYEYKETRKYENAQAFLKDFKGYLHCDGYQAYHNLPPDIIVVGCWSHCRRYWEKLYESIPKDKRDGTNAECGLVYVNVLFTLEEDFHDLTPDERYQKRLQYSKPISDDFFAWVGSLSALPKSLFGEAVYYTLSQRTYLENVFLDGRLEFSNNRAERSIKSYVTGRKNWLFANTPNGAESSSILYSIIETAKENALNPFSYLKYLLETLPTAKVGDLKKLLPWSVDLPEDCRSKAKKIDTKPKRKKDKGSLLLAQAKLREKYGIPLHQS